MATGAISLFAILNTVSCPTQQNLKYAIVFNSITKSCHSKKGLDFPSKHETCKKNNNSMILGYENVSNET